MELLICVVLLGSIILSCYMMTLQDRRIIDEKTLEENVKRADQYEIASLKGWEPEVYKLAFYTLIKSGYLIKKEENDVGIKTAHNYYLDKNKNLDVLQDVERAMALAYEDEKLLSVDLQKKVKALLEGYNEKIKNLYLEHNLNRSVGGAFLDCLFNLIIIICPFAFYAIFKNMLNMFIMIAMSTGTFFVLKKIMWNSHELTPNGKLYVALFEKIHFPYPDMNKMVIDKEMRFGDYMAIITPCSL